MRNILLSLLLLLVLKSNAQHLKHGNIWILGQGGNSVKAGTIMDFNKIPVMVSYLEKDFSMAGGTNVSISDTDGDLLFYSNGCAIWDSNHQMMPNSHEILPNMQFLGCPESAAASIFGAMILPEPCDKDSYKYINLERNTTFTVIGTLPATSLMYSQIDMTLNEGKGEVTDKHIPILSDTLSPGNVSATRHANGRDWWITVMKLHSNCFYSVLLNENGFQDPVKSCTGLEWIRSGVGSSHFSPDGKIYARFNPQNGLYIYDFDNETGVLNSREQIYFPDDDFHVQSGATISPNSRFLYASAREHLYQFDLFADTIDNTRELVGIWDGTQDPQSTIFHQSMLAPDGKIYITSWSTTSSLHIVHEPNKKGQLCRLEQRGLRFPEKDGIVAWNGNAIPNIPYFGVEPDKSFCDSLLMIDKTFDPKFEALDLTIYPNPTQEILTLELDLQRKIEAVSIYDITGKTIFKKNFATLSTKTLDLDTSALPSGVYFISLYTMRGYVRRKFIKL